MDQEMETSGITWILLCRYLFHLSLQIPERSPIRYSSRYCTAGLDGAAGPAAKERAGGIFLDSINEHSNSVTVVTSKAYAAIVPEYSFASNHLL